MSESTCAMFRLAGGPDLAARALWIAVIVADLIALLVVLPVPAALLLAPVLVRADRIDMGIWQIDNAAEGWLAAVPGLLLVGLIAVVAARVFRAQTAWTSSIVAAVRQSTAAREMDRGMSELKERESQVLRLMSRGYTNGAIAKELFISEATVRKYVGRIFARLDVDQASRDRRVTAVLAYMAQSSRPEAAKEG